MCGIAGYDYFNNARTPRGLTEELLAALRHRGPDGEGAQGFNRTAAGVSTVDITHAPLCMVHTRLAIIDLSAAGAQPLPNESGRIWLTLNGEIYNFRELRHELEALGHRFRSRTDAEVVVHGYEAWGAEVVPRLRGMFAFALFDVDRDRWLCARDPFGIKPLVYTHTADLFAFASDLDALRRVPGLDASLDGEAVGQYLALGYVPAPRTIAAGAKKLPRGHTLEVSPEGARLRRYATTRPAPGFRSLEEAVAATMDAVQESVETHLVADVPVGSFLSGGVDSSLVSGLAARAGAHPTCFTLGFAEQAFDEREHARRVAERLGLPWKAEQATAERTRDMLVDLPRIFDEPFADPSAAPTAMVAALARRDVKCVLSGDGGDELFLGYTRYRLFAIADRLRTTPRPLRRALSTVSGRIPGRMVDRVYGGLRSFGGLPRLRHPARKLQAVAHSLVQEDRVALYADTLRVASGPVLDRLLPGTEKVALAPLRQAAKSAPSAAWRYGSAIDEETYLPEDILTKVDRATMAVGLEARVPLLDPAVARLARAIPTELHSHGGGKAVLRAALDRVVPPELTRRPKQGFSIPLADWLRGPLADLVHRCTRDSRLTDVGLSRRGIRGIASEHLDGRLDHSPALWALICLGRYLERLEEPCR